MTVRVAVPNRGALGAIIAASLLVGCTVDFEPTEATGPSGPGTLPAMLSAQLLLLTGESQEIAGPPRAAANTSTRRREAGSALGEEVQSTVRFNASFFPGRDARGVIRAVTKDTIAVLDRKIVGQEADPGGVLVFSDEWSLRLNDGEGAGRLQAPYVAGREQPSPTLEFRLCRGEGPYDLAISRDDTVRFEISCPDVVNPANQAHWEITFRSADGRSFLGFSGADSPPSSVPMPALTLEHLGQSELVATLRVNEAWGQVSAKDYEVFLAIVSESSWTLRWK